MRNNVFKGPNEISYWEKGNMVEPISENKVSITYFEVEEIKDYLHNKYKELRYKHITPKIVIFPEDVYRILQGYFCESHFPFGSLEGWLEAVYHIGTTIHGPHIEGIGMY
jgi:hypothetical protein